MSNYPFINRELSWLGFNERVLFEADDELVPLIEKLKFLAIFSSNLDEFFMIRVAGVIDQIAAGYEKPDQSGYTPSELLKQISERCHKLTEKQHELYESLKKECEKHHIVINPEITDELDEIAESIFYDEIMPVLSPVTLSPANPFPFIYNQRLCIVVRMFKDDEEHISLVTIPDNIQRVFTIKLHRAYYITVENIIMKYLDRIFTGYEIKDSYIFRVTRNADLTLDEEEAEDLLLTIKKKLSKRRKGNTVRMEINRKLPDDIFELLTEKMNVDEDDVYIAGKDLDLTFLFSISSGNKELYYKDFKPLRPGNIKEYENIFDRIKDQDIILYRPYHDFFLISEMIESAARDKDVLAIKMTLYRANKGSKIISSLVSAAQAGKHVCVVIELKARFDEERNVEWATRLEQAGCIVTYGIPGLKIHSKNMLIIRKEKGRIVRYSHMATGNYNEFTAGIYTDIDYLTANDEVGRETASIFNLLTGYTETAQWDHYVLSPKKIRDRIFELIDNEIENAKKGKKAYMMAKVNSLIDTPMINKLYDAGAAGVKIDLVIRGICGLKTGVKSISENIRVKSIVGRFLEHPRIVYFHNGGDERIFFSSADWMGRNLDRRVEFMFEVRNDKCKQFLIDMMMQNLADNVKAWELDGDVFKKVETKGKKINSQEYYLDAEELLKNV